MRYHLDAVRTAPIEEFDILLYYIHDGNREIEGGALLFRQSGATVFCVANQNEKNGAPGRSWLHT
jgi:hypothetical protein